MTELALTVRMLRMNIKEPTDLREYLRPDEFWCFCGRTWGIHVVYLVSPVYRTLNFLELTAINTLWGDTVSIVR